MTPRSRPRDIFDSDSGPPNVLVVCDSHLLAAVATELAADADVRLVTDCDGVAARTDGADGVRTTAGDVTDAETLSAASGAETDVALVALDTDQRTLLVTQLLRTRLDVETVIVLVADPELREAFDDVATVTVAGGSVLADAFCQQTATALAPTESA